MSDSATGMLDLFHSVEEEQGVAEILCFQKATEGCVLWPPYSYPHKSPSKIYTSINSMNYR